MKNPVVLLLFYFLLISNITKAQHCEELNEWVLSIENQFPGVDFQHVRDGSELFKKIRHNLLSDKYFTPLFESPFDQLSSSKLYRLKNKIDNCQPKLMGSKARQARLKELEGTNRLDFYLGHVFTQDRVYREVIEQIKMLKALRSNYDKELVLFENSQLSLDELARYKMETSYKYSALLPSEIKFYNQQIADCESVIASKELKSKLNRLVDRPNDLTTLDDLFGFKVANRRLYSLLDDQKLKELDALQQKKLISIFNFYDSNIRKEPNNWIGYYDRACAYFTARKLKQSLSDINKAIQLSSTPEYDSYYLRANIYFQTNEYHRSISDISKCIEISPDKIQLYYFRAATYFNIQDYSNALNDYHHVIDKSSRINCTHYYERGLANYYLKNYSDGLKDLNIVLKYEPKNADAYYWRGNVHKRLNQDNYARNDFKKASQLAPHNKTYQKAYSDYQYHIGLEDVILLGIGVTLLNTLFSDDSNSTRSGSSKNANCIFCHGTGEKRCSYCGGWGHADSFSGFGRCDFCNGQGWVECDHY